jgi:hypothetical protein
MSSCSGENPSAVSFAPGESTAVDPTLSPPYAAPIRAFSSSAIACVIGGASLSNSSESPLIARFASRRSA